MMAAPHLIPTLLACSLAAAGLAACGGDDALGAARAPRLGDPGDSPRSVAFEDSLRQCFFYNDRELPEGYAGGYGQAAFTVQGQRLSGYSRFFDTPDGPNTFSFNSLSTTSACYQNFVVDFSRIDKFAVGAEQVAALPSYKRCDIGPNQGPNYRDFDEPSVYGGYYAYDDYEVGYLPDTLPGRAPRLVVDYVDTVGRFVAGRFAGGFIIDRSCQSFVDAALYDRITVDDGTFAVRY